MGHLTDGELRRMHDEPLTIAEAGRGHLAGCPRCRARYDAVAADASHAARLLGAPGSVPNVEAAWNAVQARVGSGGRAPRLVQRFSAALQLSWPRLARPALAVALAAILAVAAVSTGIAQNLLTIFEPKEIVGIPVTRGDLEAAAYGLPDLSAYGTLDWTPPRPLPVADGATAATQTGLPIPAAVSLPNGVQPDADYLVYPRSTGSFAFSAERARAAAARGDRTPPPMPASIDGSRLYVAVGPTVVITYGGTLRTPAEGAAGKQAGGGFPSVAITISKAPTVYSNGVSVKQLEDYLLAQPGISPRLAAQIRAIGDPASTLPIPIPVDLAGSHEVRVQGVKGVFVGDSTGLGSGVIWQKNGIVYAVAGMLTESQVLAVASSLR